jgi:HK97 family phage portal protein
LKFWNPFRKKEVRQTLEEVLISGSALANEISKEQAMNIPSVSACVNLIADTISSLPIHLYKENGDKVEIVKDSRVALLNEETKDALNGQQFKRAMVEDFLLEGAGYAYINRSRNDVKSIHYVDNMHIGVNASVDPIFKANTIHVNGIPYRDWEFVKFTRKSKDGITGKGIIDENNTILSVSYQSIMYELGLVKTGGSKKGFLKAQGRLSSDAISELKNAWKNLFKTNSENNVVVLNNGLEFQEASQTSVELQLSEHKESNSNEICKLFLVPPNILSGDAKDEEYNNWIKVCIMPILSAFECALNKDLLLPSEKEAFFFAFDATELMKGDIEKRFSAYEIGVKSGILQIDEVRYKENLPPLGLKFIKLGLQDVLYFSEKDEIYSPNTNKLAKIGEPTEEQLNPGTNNSNPIPNEPKDPRINQI